MATCKDCLHSEVCKELEQKNGIPKIFTCQCAFFENKADFVEVVRCENCTRRVDYEGRIMCNKFGHKFQGEWYGLSATTKDHFCSYGEPVNYGSSKTERK